MLTSIWRTASTRARRAVAISALSWSSPVRSRLNRFSPTWATDSSVVKPRKETVARAPGCPPKTFSVQCGSASLSQEGNTMFGPGEYRPDPSAGITAPADLPQPEIIPYSRNAIRQPCPCCGHSAYRDKQYQRTLHDLGNLDLWC